MVLVALFLWVLVACPILMMDFSLIAFDSFRISSTLVFGLGPAGRGLLPRAGVFFRVAALQTCSKALLISSVTLSVLVDSAHWVFWAGSYILASNTSNTVEFDRAA